MPFKYLSSGAELERELEGTRYRHRLVAEGGDREFPGSGRCLRAQVAV